LAEKASNMVMKMAMRLMQFVVPLVAGIAVFPGCGKSEPQTIGRLVICDHSGGVLGDIVFSATRPPSRLEIEQRLASLAPALPKNGCPIRVAMAMVLDPADVFKGSRTLADFKASLAGAHTVFSSFDVADEARGIVVYRHDPGKWMEKPSGEQMGPDANRSGYWRYAVAEDLAHSLADKVK
jgi:hypothetical protein